MADIALWNGDICDLEVDAIVSPASTSLRMATGVAGPITRRGGDAYDPFRLALTVAAAPPAGTLA